MIDESDPGAARPDEHGAAGRMGDGFETRVGRSVPPNTQAATSVPPAARDSAGQAGSVLAEMAAALRTQLSADVVAVVGGTLEADGQARLGLIVLTADTVIFFRSSAGAQERIDRPRTAALWADADAG